MSPAASYSVYSPSLGSSRPETIDMGTPPNLFSARQPSPEVLAKVKSRGAPMPSRQPDSSFRDPRSVPQSRPPVTTHRPRPQHQRSLSANAVPSLATPSLRTPTGGGGGGAPDPRFLAQRRESLRMKQEQPFDTPATYSMPPPPDNSSSFRPARPMPPKPRRQMSRSNPDFFAAQAALREPYPPPSGALHSRRDSLGLPSGQMYPQVMEPRSLAPPPPVSGRPMPPRAPRRQMSRSNPDLAARNQVLRETYPPVHREHNHHHHHHHQALSATPSPSMTPKTPALRSPEPEAYPVRLGELRQMISQYPDEMAKELSDFHDRCRDLLELQDMEDGAFDDLDLMHIERKAHEAADSLRDGIAMDEARLAELDAKLAELTEATG